MNIHLLTRYIFFTLLTFSHVSVAAPPDTVITGLIQHHVVEVGNSDAPATYLNPIQYTAGVEKCNSGTPSTETKCPSDLFYTPQAHTGGYQSFGVGITSFNGGTVWFPDCYIYWTYDINGNYYPYISCYWYSVTVPDFSLGTAAGRIKFGANNWNSPWGNKPMSTTAFKANLTYSPYVPSVACSINYNNLSDAPCNPAQQNRYGIPDNGYEDKIIMTDKGCDVPATYPWLNKRSGTASDASYGCFVADGYWGTNLPSPYPDTTYLDGQDYFQPGMGTAQPDLITEGAFYVWYYEFSQWGLEGGAGNWRFQHNSAITTFKDGTVLNCGASTLWMCYFTVDQVRIAPYADYP